MAKTPKPPTMLAVGRRRGFETTVEPESYALLTSGKTPLVILVGSELAEGATISVSANGLGTHNLDITTLGLGDGILDAGTLGQDIGTFVHPASGMTIEQENPSNQDVSYSNDMGFRTLRSQGTSSGSRTGSFQFDYGENIPLNTPILFSRWTYPMIDGTQSGSSETQWKHYRFHPYPFLGYDDPPGNAGNAGNSIYLTDTYNGTRRRIIHYSPTGTATSLPGYCPALNERRWHRMDTIFNPGSLNTANGYCTSRQVIPETGTYYPWDYYGPNGSGASAVNRQFMSSSYPWQAIRYIHVEDYRENGAINSRIYHNDYYFQVGDTKLIEIGNASTYSACTHTEIQYPLAWADDGCQFRLHYGGRGLAQAAQLYVFITEVVNGSTQVLASGPLTSTTLVLS